MTAAVLHFPGAEAPAAPSGLNLTAEEVHDAAGGYLRPADQLRELHARGFTRAYIPKVGRKRVILERAHYDAVVRGQYGQGSAGEPKHPEPPAPNRAGLREFFEKRRQ